MIDDVKSHDIAHFFRDRCSTRAIENVLIIEYIWSHLLGRAVDGGEEVRNTGLQLIFELDWSFR